MKDERTQEQHGPAPSTATSQSGTQGSNQANVDAAAWLHQLYAKPATEQDDGKEPVVSYADKYLAVSIEDLPRLHRRLKTVEALLLAKNNGGVAVLGDLAGAHAERQLLLNGIAVLEKGAGIYQGDQSPDPLPAKVTATDCIKLVMEVLEKVFSQLGRLGDWVAIENQAYAYSRQRSAKGLAGLDLQRALQEKLGWVGVFFAADTKSKDNGGEHAHRAATASSEGTYYDSPKTPGILVQRQRQVLNYRPDAGTGTTRQTLDLDHLRQLPFGVVSVRGGEHMAIIAHGRIIEAHWDESATSVATITSTDLAEWEWMSGAVVAPTADIERAWSQPIPPRVVDGEPLDPRREALGKRAGELVDESAVLYTVFLECLAGTKRADDKLERFAAVIQEMNAMPQIKSSLQRSPGLYGQCLSLMHWSELAAAFWSKHVADVYAGYAALHLECPDYGRLNRFDTLAAINHFDHAAAGNHAAPVTRASTLLEWLRYCGDPDWVAPID